MYINLPSSFQARIAAIGIDTGATPEEGLDKGMFSIDVRTLDKPHLDQLYEALKPLSGEPDVCRSARSQINSYKKSSENPLNAKAESSRALAGALLNYLVTDPLDGWIYKVATNPIPALITAVTYHPPVKERGGYFSEAYIEIKYVQNIKGKAEHGHSQITAGKTAKMSPDECLRAMGWQKETEELRSLYSEQLARYKKIRPLFGKQLVLSKEHLMEVEDEERGWGYSRKPKKTVNLMQDNGGRLVHNDPMTESSVAVSRYRTDDPDNPFLSEALKAMLERVKDKPEDAFTRAPWHLVMNVYHLGQHRDLKVHVQDVEVYKYDKTMRAKLVLPGMYGEVLDVLTMEADFTQEDIVQGKTGGNCIMLAGPPGLAKTLTAEVYAEFREKPLLKIHSGQLGTNAKTIEENLLRFYKLGQAWGCPILLDEFDVFGRARGLDLEQNAVVAVFLRTLEYQDNTMFLTTNRADSMDDAILSRMMAIILFEMPSYDVLKSIWHVLRDQYLKSLTNEMIDELMQFWKIEKKKMSGRDVKNILKLAGRYELAGKAISVDLLKVCAGFRGV